LAGIGFKLFIKLIFRNKGFAFKRIFRFLFILQNAFWTDVFAFIERIKYRRKILTYQAPFNPIFIIGHWRTGTTLLHKILSLHPDFMAPNLLNVSVPDAYIFAGRYYEKIIKLFLNDKRPMDNVKPGIYEPQEEEYALMKKIYGLPLHDVVFKENKKYFLLNHLELKADKNLFKKEFLFFYKKLAFHTKKEIIFKNPFNSFRIKVLKEIFPEAKFVYIKRDPLKVVPSTRNMFNIITRRNTLKKKIYNISLDEIAQGFKLTEDIIERDLEVIKKENIYCTTYEDLIENPHKICKNIFNAFNIQTSETYIENINSYLYSVKDFKKNNFVLSENEKKMICHICD
jgi:hypothetical protein